MVFPVLHSKNGEDGTVQGLFELAHIPYIGSRISSSAIGIDKALTKSLLSYAKVPTLEFFVVIKHQWETDPDVIRDKIEKRIGFPCIIKPSSIGSAIGITKSENADELDMAINNAFKYDRKVIAEKWIEKRELFCGILGNEHPMVSNIGELTPDTIFYENPRSKHFDDDTQLIIPADIPENTAQQIIEYSVKTYKIMDCCGLARFDFLMDKKTGCVYMVEVNTIPGFTEKSIFPKLWENSGVSFQELIDRLVDLAVERYREEKKISEFFK